MKDVVEALNEYQQFVDTVTSSESRNVDFFVANIKALSTRGANPERLLTAAIGISAEGGEFAEIVKKIIFQGKPYDDATKIHLRKELGDCLWYLIQACIALDINLYDVISTNIQKLESRYPGGKFDSFFSENRKEGDI